MDVSLYDLAVSIKQPLQPLTISAATLLSLVESAINLLVEQKISSTLWVKLPPEEIWQAQIDRYHKQVGLPHTIYNCNSYTDNPQQATTISPQEQGLEVDATQGVPPGEQRKVDFAAGTSLVSVQLAADSQLKREYFLLVLSPQFCSLILAQRARIKRQPSEAAKPAPLLAITSFEPVVIAQVLDGIKQAIAYSLVSNQSATEKTTLNNLLANWERFIPTTTDPRLLGELLAKQIQQQEIRSNTSARNQGVNTNKALEQQNHELLNTLNLKDDFVNELCQELRTPLAHMKMALSLLNSPQLKLTQRQRYLQMLNTECDRQNSLINGLLDLMQLDRNPEQSPFQPVRLSEIVPGVVSTYQPLAQEKGIMLAYTVPEDLPAVSCPSTWLKQIVINLLHNSIKFTLTGGQVWVRARLQGDYVQLEFRDTGIGIAANEIPKIFDRFYRIRLAASEDPGGAGLGLTIVQQLLLRCGGSISVKSKLAEGSSFNILLPVASPGNSQVS
jgi:two-component system, OmpR family, phosphate regulon sensor histidine kinase PhoR